MNAEIATERIAKALQSSGAPPEFVYAFRKTGRIASTENWHLLTREEKKEWKAACEEYRSNPLCSDINLSILNEGRSGIVRIVVAAAILEAPGQPDRLVTYSDEYGDGEGEAFIRNFIEEVQQSDLLKSGEKLRSETFHFDWPVRK